MSLVRVCSTDTSIVGIADTGTTLLYLPAAVVKAYYAEVDGAAVSDAQDLPLQPGSFRERKKKPTADTHTLLSVQNSLIYGGYVFDCDADLPDFTFGVGTSTITIPGEYMNYVSFAPLPLSENTTHEY